MRRWMVVVIWSVFTAACAGLKVEQDYDTSVNFQTLNTYAWQPRAGKEKGEGSLLDSRVRNAVDRELAEKGYRKVAAVKADYLVSYHYTVASEDEPNRVRTSVGVGGGSGGTFGGIGLSIGLGRDKERSILGIDVIDPEKGKVLWRGVARQGPITQSDPAKTTAKINETVEAILREYPPERTANR